MRLLAMLAAAPLLGGCYVLRQAAGQVEILMGQEDIETLIESDRVSADEARKLVVVREVRAFAARRVGLVPGANYTTFYDTRGRPVSFVVSGCRQDRFENHVWWFPVVGSFAYKGFFSRADAEAEARALRDDGYDTTIREVAAYSTLGWFRDPVFSSMLRRTEADLVALVLHELTHGTVHVEGRTDFNETMAQFVGVEAALEFLAERYGPDSREVASARSQFHDDELFDAFIRALYARLDALYRGPVPSEEKRLRREEAFAAARAEFARLKPRFKTPAYYFFERAPLNNAEIVAHRRYGGYEVFRRIFERGNRSWVTFLWSMRVAAASGDPERFCAALAAGRVDAER